MIDKFLTKVFGSSNQRYLKTIRPIIARINELEPSVKRLSDEELRARTAQFKEQVARATADATDPEDLKRRERMILDELLPEAFATVREASVRSTGSGWARFIASSASKSAAYRTTWTTSSARPPTPQTSPTARTTSSASIT